MGFDGYVESMGKTKEAEEKARQNTRTERERERRKEGKIQAGGEGTKGHTPCLGNGLQFQKFFFSFFRGAFFWGRGMSNTYYEGRERGELTGSWLEVSVVVIDSIQRVYLLLVSLL